MLEKENSIDENELGNTVRDYVARSVKCGVSVIPCLGPIIAEFVTDIIPRQRIDRIAEFLNQLNKKLIRLETTIDKFMLEDEAKSRLMEESIQQAANSSSFERRAYLASLVAQGISKSQLEIQNESYFLNLLRQVNDAEIIVLRYFLESNPDKRREFENRNSTLFSCKTNDKNLDVHFYIEHLESLGLLYRRVYPERVLTENGESIYVSQYQDEKSQLPMGLMMITFQGKELLSKISFGNDWLN
ncbi:hypothetical protein [Akkermansia sp.]|uniref:hypothetical protein n=1 Tax=Akkermansia sp. TaxID=1872421 RepID=UPI003AB328BF